MCWRRKPVTSTGLLVPGGVAAPEPFAAVLWTGAELLDRVAAPGAADGLAGYIRALRCAAGLGPLGKLIVVDLNKFV